MSVSSQLPPVAARPTPVQPQPPPRRRWPAVLLVVLTLALVGAILIGTDMLIGMGQVVTETRDVTAFSAVQVNGSNTVNIRVGDEQRVTVRGDAGAVDRLETAVRDGTLIIAHRGWFGAFGAPSVDIAIPELEGVSLRGSGTIVADGVDAESLAVTLPGSGIIELRGTARAADVMLAGSGAVRLSDLAARDATVTVTGSGEVRVHATGSLRATITGSGTVRYSGDPETVDDSVTGSGVIEKE